MRRADLSRAWTACALALVFGLASCGGEKPRQELTFESLDPAPDTSGLSAGAAVVESVEPYRLANGAVRVKGRVRLPDGTLLQIGLKAPGENVFVAVAQVRVQGESFDTPPLLGEHGPLPRGPYRVELLSHFTPDWQGPEGAVALQAGPRLRGPGITRARDGAAALFLVTEARL
jgi:hypothetical protein